MEKTSMGVNILPENDNFLFVLLACEGQPWRLESSITASDAVTLPVTSVCLSAVLDTVAPRSCDRDGLSVLPGVSACQVITWRFLWTCDSVKTYVWWGRRTVDRARCEFWLFFGWCESSRTFSSDRITICNNVPHSFPRRRISYFLTTHTDKITLFWSKSSGHVT